MEPSKQIKAIAQTYLQEQQLREQAEYIAVLENTIITIANEIGIEPQQLINELNVGGAIKSGFQQGGVMGAIKGGVRAIGHNMRAASTEGGMALPTQGNRLAGSASRAQAKVTSGSNVLSDIKSERQSLSAKGAAKAGPMFDRFAKRASTTQSAGERGLGKVRDVGQNLPGDNTGGKIVGAMKSVARGMGRGAVNSAQSGFGYQV
jgi:hypothetical protein